MKYLALAVAALALTGCTVVDSLPIVGGYAKKGQEAVIEQLEPIACLPKGNYTGFLLKDGDTEYPADVAAAIETIRDYRCPDRQPAE